MLYLVDGGGVGIGKVFDIVASISASYYEVFNVAVSSGASNGGAFVVVFGMWR